MDANVVTIPHRAQRYETVGDWFKDSLGTYQVRVSDMQNEDYEFLVAIHELVEAYLCEKRGICEEDVTKFDLDFEENRAEDNTDEPGASALAPYKKEHDFATKIEKEIALELGVDWDKYDEAVNSLAQTPQSNLRTDFSI